MLVHALPGEPPAGDRRDDAVLAAQLRQLVHAVDLADEHGVGREVTVLNRQRSGIARCSHTALPDRASLRSSRRVDVDAGSGAGL